MRFVAVLLFYAVAVCSSPALAQQYDSAYGKPLIYLREMSKFGLLSSLPGIPTFALYEKGQVIYTTNRDKDPQIYQVVLTCREVENVIAALAIPDSFYVLNERIIAEGTSDIGDNAIALDLGKTKTVSVYGYLEDKGLARRQTPSPFLSLYDKIRKYRDQKAVKWVPRQVEVALEPYDDYYVDSATKTPWMAGLPDLVSPTTKALSDSYVITIDGKKFDEFKKYYSALDRAKAVDINGKRMIVSYSVPFPNIQ